MGWIATSFFLAPSFVLAKNASDFGGFLKPIYPGSEQCKSWLIT